MRRLEMMRTKNGNETMRLFAILFTILFSLFTSEALSQPVMELIEKNPAYASCNYSIYPDSIPDNLTPAPSGKRPFYISHYGRHGSRYISNRKGYDTPYKMMLHAGAVDELTPVGKKVLDEMTLILNDTEGRWGELTVLGSRQERQIARRMIQRFPEVFEGAAHVDAKSTVVARCITSMGYAMMEMAQLNPQLQITMRASKRDQDYMNHQDLRSRKNYMTPETQKAYDAYIAQSVPRRYFCPEPTLLFIVSRMGKGKKRQVMFWNRIFANKLRRIDFFFVYWKRYAWKKSVRLFVLGNV